MDDLILVAASGLARETAAAVEAGEHYRLRGFLDDDPALEGVELMGLPVLGSSTQGAKYRSAKFLVCAGPSRSRRLIVERLQTMGITNDRFATVVHPQASVHASCRIGPGSIVLAHGVLTVDVQVGKHVVLMPNVTLTHDSTVADFATLCAGVTLGGQVTVSEGAYVGMNAAIRQDVTVHTGATVGMGAVVLTDVPRDEVWAGVPARSISKSQIPATSPSPMGGLAP